MAAPAGAAVVAEPAAAGPGKVGRVQEREAAAGRAAACPVPPVLQEFPARAGEAALPLALDALAAVAVEQGAGRELADRVPPATVRPAALLRERVAGCLQDGHRGARWDSAQPGVSALARADRLANPGRAALPAAPADRVRAVVPWARAARLDRAGSYRDASAVAAVRVVRAGSGQVVLRGAPAFGRGRGHGVGPGVPVSFPEAHLRRAALVGCRLGPHEELVRRRQLEPMSAVWKGLAVPRRPTERRPSSSLWPEWSW